MENVQHILFHFFEIIVVDRQNLAIVISRLKGIYSHVFLLHQRSVNLSEIPCENLRSYKPLKVWILRHDLSPVLLSNRVAYQICLRHVIECKPLFKANLITSDHS